MVGQLHVWITDPLKRAGEGGKADVLHREIAQFFGNLIPYGNELVDGERQALSVWQETL
jgi:hypothetical protein